MKFNKYENLNQAKKALFYRGYTHQFVVKDKKLINKKNKRVYLHKDIEIVEYHRFNNKNRLNQTALVCAIECKGKIKGMLVSSYGDYADMQLIKFMDKVKIKSRAVAASS